jgi:cell division protein FtsL
MKMNRVPLVHLNPKVRREHDISALSRLVLLLFCGLALTSGFLLAAKQHFAAVQFGYKSEELRRENQQLLEERQRLQLMKEEATSPVRLEPAARGIGLQPVEPGQVAVGKPGKGSDAHPAVVIKSAASVPR